MFVTHFNHRCVCVFMLVKRRMQRSWGSFSSAQRTRVTLWRSVSQSRLGETSGSMALRWRRHSDSLSSCASKRGSRRSGWTPSDRSSLGPWHRRIILVSKAAKWRQRCKVCEYVNYLYDIIVIPVMWKLELFAFWIWSSGGWENGCMLTCKGTARVTPK